MIEMTAEQRRQYGLARVRDAMFDAVRALWAQRKGEGMTLAELSQRMGRSPEVVSSYLQGPAAWSAGVFGAFVQSLDGEAEISVVPLEKRPEAA